MSFFVSLQENRIALAWPVSMTCRFDERWFQGASCLSETGECRWTGSQHLLVFICRLRVRMGRSSWRYSP